MKKKIIAKFRIRDCIKTMFCFCFIPILCKNIWVALPIIIEEPSIFGLELIMAYVYSIWNLCKNVVEVFTEAATRGTSDESQSH